LVILVSHVSIHNHRKKLDPICYRLNPATYYIGGVMSATFKSVTVECTESEATYFNPPPGSTCSSYSESFVTQFGGYLTNPNATTECGYCQYRDGIEFMTTLNIQPSDKWRNMVIFLAFCISNWALVYFFIYTVRIKRWTFGFGTVSGGFRRAVSTVKGAIFKN
jgi:ATP-binding cassette subfamily G (WHITE) protein 2 (SNQ2)